MAIRGQSQEGGGTVRDIIMVTFGKPLGQPLATLWMVAGHVLGVYAL